MPQVMSGGFLTGVRHFGQGDRKALLIHCSLGHSGSWAPLAELLGDTLDMVAFDLPGHGQSGDWCPSDGEIQGLATDMAAGLLTEPADIIGHSFGATVALRLALERPELVRSLTLIETRVFQCRAGRCPGPAGAIS